MKGKSLKRKVCLLFGMSLIFLQTDIVNAEFYTSKSGQEYSMNERIPFDPFSEKNGNFELPIIEPNYGQNYINVNQILGNEDFIHVSEEESYKFPYSTAAYVESEFIVGNTIKKYVGSANFIANNVLITAAHNVFSWDNGGIRAKDVYVTPIKNNNGKKPYGVFKVKDYFYISEYGKLNSFEHDLAVLVLEENSGIGYITGTLGLTETIANKSGLRVINVGYPIRQEDFDVENKKIDAKLYKVSGRILRDDDKMLYYTLDTLKGSSGSALFDSKFRVVGVVVAEDTKNLENMAIKLNERNLKFIHATLSKVKLDGWKKIENNWYYYTNGEYKIGWYQLENEWYYFNNEGHLLTGWQKINNLWYYFDEIGEMVTGWIQLNDKWYYLLQNGLMATGWHKINEKWYYLDNINGDMKIGWLYLNNKWYYLNSTGAMVTGTHIIDNRLYTFNSLGEWIK